MITIEDCIAMCDVSEEVVLALAEHERIELVHAVALAQSLAGDARGRERLRDVLAENVSAARIEGDGQSARQRQAVLDRFMAANPGLAPPDVEARCGMPRAAPRPAYAEAMLFSMRLWLGAIGGRRHAA